jgi:hypothetical protein
VLRGCGRVEVSGAIEEGEQRDADAPKGNRRQWKRRNGSELRHGFLER